MIDPICPTCGALITIAGARFCGSCAVDRLLKSLFEDPDEDEDMSPEEAFHDTRREDWEREQYRRMDAEDQAEHMPHGDEPISDNWFDYEDEPQEDEGE